MSLLGGTFVVFGLLTDLFLGCSIVFLFFLVIGYVWPFDETVLL